MSLSVILRPMRVQVSITCLLLLQHLLAVDDDDALVVGANALAREVEAGVFPVTSVIFPQQSKQAMNWPRQQWMHIFIVLLNISVLTQQQ